MFVKICGITSEEDALLAVALGADAVGFVFAPSPRQIAPQRARDIARRLPPEVMTVGVFRDELPARILDIVGDTGLRGVQLHGREGPDVAAAVRARVPFLVQAFSAGDPVVQRAADYGVDAVMLDGKAPGSGLPFDWALADDAPRGLRIVLAGGLTPDNVGAAIAQVAPWGVDVSSGVEAAPGRKDARKLRAFLVAARTAARDLATANPRAPSVGDLFDWQDDDDMAGGRR